MPILVKIAPDLTEDALEEAAGRLHRRAGVSGLIATNTTLARDGARAGRPGLAGRGRRPVRGAADRPGPGGGRASCRAHRLPMIGVGGIMTRDDGRAMLDAGASLLQIYTGFIYRGPALVAELNQLVAATTRSRGGRR